MNTNLVFLSKLIKIAIGSCLVVLLLVTSVAHAHSYYRLEFYDYNVGPYDDFNDQSFGYYQYPDPWFQPDVMIDSSSPQYDEQDEPICETFEICDRYTDECWLEDRCHN
ncbi:MAG: hypothetical protein ACOVQX_01770 [Legionella sp.]